MTGPQVAWYVTRLAQIPSSPLTGTGVLDNAGGAAECRRIGYAIHRQEGCEGMLQVWLAYRDSLGAEPADEIARAWIGIGQWQRPPAA
jgi:hypothetical protein